MKSLLTSLQEAKQANKTESSLFGGGLNIGNVQLNGTDEEIATQAKQALNTVCSADVTNVQSNNLIYARNANTGNLGFKQDGNAEADCIITNSAIADYNIKQKGDQSNTTSAIGGGIVGAIVLIIIIIVVIGAIMKFSKAQKAGAAQMNAPPAQPYAGAAPSRPPSSVALK
ncbi:MAG: hypothetical protein ACMG6E_09155 [Candidatus Roizmanbacteria bacterium]